MGRKPQVEAAEGLPAWVMTYSDVITLLMTFFVLLLTFATAEPENFERMRFSMFGGGAGTGIAGAAHSGLDHDAVLWRERPKTARLSTRGAEMPASSGDALLTSVAKGLSSLGDADSQQPAQGGSDIHRRHLPVMDSRTDSASPDYHGNPRIVRVR